MLDEHMLDEDDALEVFIIFFINIVKIICILILLYFLFKDDFCDSDIEDSKVLSDIAEKEENNVGNGINHEEEEVKQVF